MNERITAIILAAGESTRMGRLKQLLPWGDATLLQWQVEQMRAADADDVIIVLGHEAAQIEAAAGPLAARIVVNADYRTGRASSLRRGAEAIDGPAGAVLVLGVDQPRPAWVSRLLIEHWRHTHAPIVSPLFDGRHGHPVLLDGALVDELRAVTDETLGLRAVTDRHAAAAESVPVRNSAVNVDLNLPSDYEAALSSFTAGKWDHEVD